MKPADVMFNAYRDEDYADDIEIRKSNTGYVLQHECNAIAWLHKHNR